MSDIIKVQRKINHVQKRLRAVVVKAYMEEAEIEECVCYTCGNASKYLEAEGLEVTEVIDPPEWHNEVDMYSNWGRIGIFNATSGMLPVELMVNISKLLKEHFKTDMQDVQAMEIACGSGETLVTMQMAFPNVRFTAVYNIDEATRFNMEAPLNELVKLLSH